MKITSVGGALLLLAVFGCQPSASTSSQPAPQSSAAKPADESAAIRILGSINQAQTDYLRRNRRYALTYDELVESHFLNEDPSKSGSGYEFNLHPAADAESYSIGATPTSSSATVRYFYMDKTGTVRAETGKEASASSPPIS